MFSFFKVIGYTVDSILQDPPETLPQLSNAQIRRQKTFTCFNENKVFDTVEKEKRKQYWHAQIFFLIRLIKNNKADISSIINGEIDLSSIDLSSPESIQAIVEKLSSSLEDPNNLTVFINILKKDDKEILEATRRDHEEKSATPPPAGIMMHHGDVISLITRQLEAGFFPIVDNAPNAHRDGVAKYSTGSLEESLSRFTDQAWKMPLHFADVHQRNREQKQCSIVSVLPKIDVAGYQRRYLQLVLLISSKILKDNTGKYLESKDFLGDLFTEEKPSAGEWPDSMPIYFGLQNNVYEVDPTHGHRSYAWFSDTSTFGTSTIQNVIEKARDEKESPSNGISVFSFAAPDQRRIVTGPLDRVSTSNTLLQHPSHPNTLKIMIENGISNQCEEAIRLRQTTTRPISVIFVMPGCGAFGNSPEKTAAYFLFAINNHYEALKQQGITCHVVEYKKETFHLLLNQWKKLSNTPKEILLNIAVRQLQELTTKYINHCKNFEPKEELQNANALLKILENKDTPETFELIYNKLQEYKNKLDDLNLKNESLDNHRSTWDSLYNAASIILVPIGIVRSIYSRANRGTWYFWQTEGQVMTEKCLQIEKNFDQEYQKIGPAKTGRG